MAQLVEHTTLAQVMPSLWVRAPHWVLVAAHAEPVPDPLSPSIVPPPLALSLSLKNKPTLKNFCKTKNKVAKRIYLKCSHHQKGTIVI